MKNKKIIIHILLCLLTNAFMAVTAYADVKTLTTVTVSPGIIENSNERMVTIIYGLAESCSTELSFFTKDFYKVRTIYRGNDHSGTNSVSWDCRDDQDTILPSGPYFFTIHSKTTKGTEYIYDPTLFSGGEKLALSIYPENYNPDNGLVTYNLPKTAVVRLRAGLHNGPLYSTILDWVSMPPGRHQVFWDGLSDDKQVHVSGQKEMVITIQAITLPENSIIIRGKATGYKPASQSRLPRKRNKVFSSIPRQFRLIQKMLEQSPVFDIKINGQVPEDAELIPINNNINIAVETDEATQAALSQNRFELVVFVDDQRWDEIEYAYVPLSYLLKTDQLETGEHLITVSIVTITEQRASRTVRIDFQR